MRRGTGEERGGRYQPSTASGLGLWVPKGLVAVLDTSVLVAAYLSMAREASPTLNIVRSAGLRYDSFTSPAILEETERVLIRPRLGASLRDARVWLDAFLRRSRQVNCFAIPGDYSEAVGGDEKDNPVLLTALAVNLHEEGQRALTEADNRHGRFIVTGDKHFKEGHVVWGWRFIRPDPFWGLLKSILP